MITSLLLEQSKLNREYDVLIDEAAVSLIKSLEYASVAPLTESVRKDTLLEAKDELMKVFLTLPVEKAIELREMLEAIFADGYEDLEEGVMDTLGDAGKSLADMKKKAFKPVSNVIGGTQKFITDDGKEIKLDKVNADDVDKYIEKDGKNIPSPDFKWFDAQGNKLDAKSAVLKYQFKDKDGNKYSEKDGKLIPFVNGKLDDTQAIKGKMEVTDGLAKKTIEGAKKLKIKISAGVKKAWDALPSGVQDILKKMGSALVKSIFAVIEGVVAGIKMALSPLVNLLKTANQKMCEGKLNASLELELSKIEALLEATPAPTKTINDVINDLETEKKGDFVDYLVSVAVQARSEDILDSSVTGDDVLKIAQAIAGKSQTGVNDKAGNPLTFADYDKLTGEHVDYLRTNKVSEKIISKLRANNLATLERSVNELEVATGDERCMCDGSLTKDIFNDMATSNNPYFNWLTANAGPVMDDFKMMNVTAALLGIVMRALSMGASMTGGSMLSANAIAAGAGVLVSPYIIPLMIVPIIPIFTSMWVRRLERKMSNGEDISVNKYKFVKNLDRIAQGIQVLNTIFNITSSFTGGMNSADTIADMMGMDTSKEIIAAQFAGLGDIGGVAINNAGELQAAFAKHGLALGSINIQDLDDTQKEVLGNLINGKVSGDAVMSLVMDLGLDPEAAKATLAMAEMASFKSSALMTVLGKFGNEVNVKSFTDILDGTIAKDAAPSAVSMATFDDGGTYLKEIFDNFKDLSDAESAKLAEMLSKGATDAEIDTFLASVGKSDMDTGLRSELLKIANESFVDTQKDLFGKLIKIPGLENFDKTIMADWDKSNLVKLNKFLEQGGKQSEVMKFLSEIEGKENMSGFTHDVSTDVAKAILARTEFIASAIEDIKADTGVDYDLIKAMVAEGPFKGQWEFLDSALANAWETEEGKTWLKDVSYALVNGRQEDLDIILADAPEKFTTQDLGVISDALETAVEKNVAWLAAMKKLGVDLTDVEFDSYKDKLKLQKLLSGGLTPTERDDAIKILVANDMDEAKAKDMLKSIPEQKVNVVDSGTNGKANGTNGKVSGTNKTDITVTAASPEDSKNLELFDKVIAENEYLKANPTIIDAIKDLSPAEKGAFAKVFTSNGAVADHNTVAAFAKLDLKFANGNIDKLKEIYGKANILKPDSYANVTDRGVMIDVKNPNGSLDKIDSNLLYMKKELYVLRDAVANDDPTARAFAGNASQDPQQAVDALQTKIATASAMKNDIVALNEVTKMNADLSKQVPGINKMGELAGKPDDASTHYARKYLKAATITVGENEFKPNDLAELQHKIAVASSSSDLTYSPEGGTPVKLSDLKAELQSKMDFMKTNGIDSHKINSSIAEEFKTNSHGADWGRSNTKEFLQDEMHVDTDSDNGKAQVAAFEKLFTVGEAGFTDPNVDVKEAAAIKLLVDDAISEYVLSNKSGDVAPKTFEKLKIAVSYLTKAKSEGGLTTEDYKAIYGADYNKYFNAAK